MKKHELVLMFIIGIFVMPRIVSASLVNEMCNNYIYAVEAAIFAILLIIGLWRKPKSKFGIMFVGMGLITLIFSSNTGKVHSICECSGGICNFDIGGSIAMILIILVNFMILYYIGWSLSRLYSKFISGKTTKNKNSEKSRKGSFVIGFFIVAIVAAIIPLVAMKIVEKQQAQEIVKKLGKSQDEVIILDSEPICSRPILNRSFYYSYDNYRKFYRMNTTISPDLKRCVFGIPDLEKLHTSDKVALSVDDISDFTYRIVLDKQEIGEYDSGFDFTFSLDSKHFAYIVRENDKEFVILDSQKNNEYDFVDHFTFSPDSKRFAYTAYKNHEHFIVLDNQEYKIENCDNIWGLTFSPDGEKFAYAVAVKGDDTAVLNGIKGKEYTRIESLAFSPDSKHFMYKVEDKRFKDKGVFVVLDNQEKPEMLDFPVFSLDGKHVAYTMEKNDKQLVILDDHKNKPYEEVSSLTFSPDGKHFAYIAKDEDNEYFVVLDNKEGEKYPKKFVPRNYYMSPIGNLRFSSDNNFFAYVVNNGRYMRYIVKEDHFVVLHNFKSEKEKKYTGGCSFLFSPNGKYFLYKSYVGDGDDWGEKSNCNIIVLNNNDDEFKIVKSYVKKKFSISNDERILNFNFIFSDDSKYIIYNKEKIIPENSFDVYYIEEAIE